MPIPFHFDSELLYTPPKPRLACTLVIDTSAGMAGTPMNEVNRLLAELESALKQQAYTPACVEISVITFADSVKTDLDFTPAFEFVPPTLTASGASSMNEAINTALDALKARKVEYRTNGFRYYLPWLFLLTAGAPTDSHLESNTRARLQKAIQENRVLYCPIGVGNGVDVAKLQSYYPDDATARPVLKANASNFTESFIWMISNIGKSPYSDLNMTTQINTPDTPTLFTIKL